MYLTNFPFYAEMINLIHQKCWVSFLIVICPAGPNVYCCVPVDEKHWRPADGVVLPVRHSVFLWYLHLYDPEHLLPDRYPWFLYRVRYRRYCVVYGYAKLVLLLIPTLWIVGGYAKLILLQIPKS